MDLPLTCFYQLVCFSSPPFFCRESPFEGWSSDDSQVPLPLCMGPNENWNDLFQSCGHCWVFQICWHIECSTFTASSFRIWNSSIGIPSPPLALFVVMLSKAHLTSHSRMPGSRSGITPSWLSGSWRSFLYSSSVYSYHLFLISSASVRSIPFLSLWWNSSWAISNPERWCCESGTV